MEPSSTTRRSTSLLALSSRRGSRIRNRVSRDESLDVRLSTREVRARVLGVVKVLYNHRSRLKKDASSWGSR